MKRIRVITSLLIALMLVLAMMPTGMSVAAAEGEKISITVRGLARETDVAAQELNEKRLAAFHEKYPDIEVELVDWAYDVNTFLPKAAAGQLPTMYGTYFTEANKIISQGFAADITEVAQAWGYDAAINKSLLDLISRDDRIYGLPANAYVLGMWYNVELFKQAGLVDANGVPVIPTTFDEMAETGVKLKEATGVAGFFFPTQNNQGGWLFSQLAWAFGAEFETQDESGNWIASFATPETTAALQYLKDLRWKYDIMQSDMMVTVSEMFKLFGTDQVAMAFGTPDWMNDPIINYGASKDNLSMGSMLEGPVAKVALTGGNFEVFSPTATADEIDACFKWLEIEGYSPKVDPEVIQGSEDTWSTNNQNGRIVGPRGIRVWMDPARVQAEDEAIAKYINVDMALFASYMDSVNNGSVTLKPEHAVYCQELYKALDSCVQAVLTDENADPAALLEKCAADFQRDYLDKTNAGSTAN